MLKLITQLNKISISIWELTQGKKRTLWHQAMAISWISQNSKFFKLLVFINVLHCEFPYGVQLKDTEVIHQWCSPYSSENERAPWNTAGGRPLIRPMLARPAVCLNSSAFTPHFTRAVQGVKPESPQIEAEICIYTGTSARCNEGAWGPSAEGVHRVPAKGF